MNVQRHTSMTVSAILKMTKVYCYEPCHQSKMLAGFRPIVIPEPLWFAVSAPYNNAFANIVSERERECW